MRIYMLTGLGKRLARSTGNPDTAAWRIVHHLDNVGHQTPDQIADSTGMSESEASGVLGALKRKGIVQEVSGGSV